MVPDSWAQPVASYAGLRQLDPNDLRAVPRGRLSAPGVDPMSSPSPLTGARLGLTIAEAEEGCRAFIEKTRPLAIDASMFEGPFPLDDGIQDQLRRAVRARVEAQERRDRETAHLWWGIHF